MGQAAFPIFRCGSHVAVIGGALMLAGCSQVVGTSAPVNDVPGAKAVTDTNGDRYELQANQLLINGQVVQQELQTELRVESVSANQRLPAGYRRQAYIDPDTGQLAWPALTCTNPDCPGNVGSTGPHLFTRPNPYISVDSQGQLIVSPNAQRVATQLDRLPCKACGRVEYVRPFESPEIVQRREDLRTIKRAIRALRRDATARGEDYAGELRTPADIDREIAELPTVYLLPSE